MSFSPPITCHVLDTTSGKPATNVKCEITFLSYPSAATDQGQPQPFATAHTNSDGRVSEWHPTESSPSSALTTLATGLGFTKYSIDHLPKTGVYKIRFHTKEYFELKKGLTFFPFIDIIFEIPQIADLHYHVPLLLSNYGYSTYRGS